MTPDLDNLSLSELVALYNEHADKPVKKFRDRKTAIARVLAVLPKQATRPVGRRAAHLDTITSMLAVGATLAQLMDATGRGDRQVRGDIDAVRRRGHTVKRTGPRAWIINGC